MYFVIPINNVLCIADLSYEQLKFKHAYINDDDLILDLGEDKRIVKKFFHLYTHNDVAYIDKEINYSAIIKYGKLTERLVNEATIVSKEFDTDITFILKFDETKYAVKMTYNEYFSNSPAANILISEEILEKLSPILYLNVNCIPIYVNYFKYGLCSVKRSRVVKFSSLVDTILQVNARQKENESHLTRYADVLSLIVMKNMTDQEIIDHCILKYAYKYGATHLADTLLQRINTDKSNLLFHVIQ